MAVADSWKQLIEMGYSSGGKTQRYIYKLDGIDDYITLGSPSILTSGDTVSLKFIAPTLIPAGATWVLIGGVRGGSPTAILWKESGTDQWESTNIVSMTLDGIPVTLGVDTMPSDGLEHEVVLVMDNVVESMNSIGARQDGGLNPSGFPIYDVDIQAASGNRFYAINDGWSANPVIADSIGGNNATANNFEESNWVRKDV